MHHSFFVSFLNFILLVLIKEHSFCLLLPKVPIFNLLWCCESYRRLFNVHTLQPFVIVGPQTVTPTFPFALSIIVLPPSTHRIQFFHATSSLIRYLFEDDRLLQLSLRHFCRANFVPFFVVSPILSHELKITIQICATMSAIYAKFAFFLVHAVCFLKFCLTVSRCGPNGVCVCDLVDKISNKGNN